MRNMTSHMTSFCSVTSLFKALVECGECKRTTSSKLFKNFISICVVFMSPAWKVRRGHLAIGSSVCPSVRLSVRNSVPLTNKVQYLKFGWWYSNQTWIVSVSMGFSHFTDITCPGWAGSKCRTYSFFAIFWLCCRRGHPCFKNTSCFK